LRNFVANVSIQLDRYSFSLHSCLCHATNLLRRNLSKPGIGKIWLQRTAKIEAGFGEIDQAAIWGVLSTSVRRGLSAAPLSRFDTF
jgi:hypothetical protein